MQNKKKFRLFKNTIRRIKYYDKTQTTYFAVMIFIAGFCLFTGATYSYFTLSGRIGNATITIAKLNYTLESTNSNYANQTLTIAPGETTFLDLDLKSLNAQKTRYALNYDTNFSGVEVYYSESIKKNVDGVIGPNGSIVNMRIVVVNNGSANATVRFDVDGGYLQNTLSSNIVNGYFEQDQTIRYVVYDEDFQSSVVGYDIPSRENHSYYKAECSNGGEPVWDEINWNFSIGNEVQTSCDVYFKKTTTGLEKYYNVLGSNGINSISTTKPDRTGEYVYQSSSCSNGAVFSFDESTFEFNIETYEPNTLCIANFTTNKEIEEAEKVIITLDSNGAGRTYSKEVSVGGTYGDLPLIKRNGYTLVGWYTEREAGEKIEADTPVNGPVTLYAHWEEMSFIPKTVSAIINNQPVEGINAGTPNFVSTATTDEGVYAMEDDYGTSYYYRGAVTNNYVKFAGFYWRIIRINGDGSLRIIYDGTQGYANGISNTGRLAYTGKQFNAQYNDNKYVGWMFGGSQGAASTSKAQAQTNETNSDIKTLVDSWYKTNIVDKNLGDKVADVVFCNDRTAPGKAETGYSSDTGLGYGSQVTAYGATARTNVWNTDASKVQPRFTCPQKNDAFTVNDETKGNGDLTYPVGLITADEIVAAGSGKYNTANSSYYLYKGSWYWSLSPYYFNGSDARVFVEDGLYYTGVDRTLGAVAPVINLKAEYASTLKGTGTMEDPYTE